MMIRKWEELPGDMQCEAIRPYYDELRRKRISLIAKMMFDRIGALCLLIILSPVFLVLAVLIKADSDGAVFFRQQRVTQYGRLFKIYKFRTMVSDAEALGAQVTSSQDMRITGIGKKLRSCRLDELPQLINILLGHMSFVGTRPEVPRYVSAYTDEMKATLLLPAGVTSQASIMFKDEERLLSNAENIDDVYIHTVLPKKMEWNLKSIMSFSFWGDIKTMMDTLWAVIR